MAKKQKEEPKVSIEGKDGRQRLSLGSFIMPLVKAVQELSAEVESLKEQLKNN